MTRFSLKERGYHQGGATNNANEMGPSRVSSKRKTLLGYYLAGLIEGDGSIIVPKTIRNQMGKLLYPKVKITFVDKDAPLAEKIREIIGLRP